MNPDTKLKIERYVSRKIAPHSVIELRDLLLYLQLIKYSKYRKLASLVNSIYDIPGMDNISECVQKLDNKLARRYFYLKKLSLLNRIHKLFKSKEEGRFKASHKEHRTYLFSVLKDKTLERIHTIATIHKLQLVETYPEILSEILKKRAETNTHDREDLELSEILKLITSMLQKQAGMAVEAATHLGTELAHEYLTNKKEIDILFQYVASTEQIKAYHDELQRILKLDTGTIFRQAENSEFAIHGTHFKIPSGVKAGLKTYFFVSIPLNILITLAIHYLVPLIPATLGIPYLVPIVVGTINILPVIVSIFVGAFYNHRSQKQDNSAKHELKLALASVVEDYLVRLNKKEIDLTGIHRYWKSNAAAKSQRRLALTNTPKLALPISNRSRAPSHHEAAVGLFKRSASPSSVTSAHSSDGETSFTPPLAAKG